MNLSISATYHTVRYEAEHWPPDPYRCLQAIISGAKHQYHGRWTEEMSDALRHLERLGPPSICLPKTVKGNGYRFPILNNESVHGHGLKPVNPTDFVDELPIITFVWNDVDYGPWMDTLSELVSHMFALGRANDCLHAKCMIGDQPSSVSVLAPLGDNERVNNSKGLRVPISGTFDEIEEVFTNSNRKTMYRVQQYYDRDSEPRIRDYMMYEVRSADSKYVTTPHRHASALSGMTRHAVSGALEGRVQDEYIETVVCGHYDNYKDRDATVRMGYIAVPTIAMHPSSDLRRMIVVFPYCIDPSIRDEIKHALNKPLDLIEERAGELYGTLVPSNGDSVFYRFVNPAKVWCTVTPVVLRGYSTKKRNGRTILNHRRTVLSALAEFGIEREWIDRIEVGSLPFFGTWSGHVDDYLRPNHLASYPLVHVFVMFKREVFGPLIAGNGVTSGFGGFVGIREVG